MIGEEHIYKWVVLSDDGEVMAFGDTIEELPHEAVCGGTLHYVYAPEDNLSVGHRIDKFLISIKLDE